MYTNSGYRFVTREDEETRLRDKRLLKEWFQNHIATLSDAQKHFMIQYTMLQRCDDNRWKMCCPLYDQHHGIYFSDPLNLQVKFSETTQLLLESWNTGHEDEIKSRQDYRGLSDDDHLYMIDLFGCEPKHFTGGFWTRGYYSLGIHEVVRYNLSKTHKWTRHVRHEVKEEQVDYYHQRQFAIETWKGVYNLKFPQLDCDVRLFCLYGPPICCHIDHGDCLANGMLYHPIKKNWAKGAEIVERDIIQWIEEQPPKPDMEAYAKGREEVDKFVVSLL